MWKAIEYSAEHFDEMIEMAREQYGKENDIANADFLQHQYFENPAGDALMDLAWDEDNSALAGQYVVWPMRFLVGKEEIICAHSLNTLTRKQYRGQGIFTGLAEKTYTRAQKLGYKFCYGTPNPNSHPGFLRKLKFQDIVAVPLFLRPLKPSAAVKDLFGSSLLGAMASPSNLLFRVKRPTVQSEYQIVQLTHENLELVDAFWRSVAGKYPIMNIRDQQFVSFRYLDMPRRTYHPFFILKNGVPVAWAVGRVMEVAGMQCGMLADFLFVDGEQDAANLLISYMLWHLKENGASVAGSLMLQHTQEAKLLKKKGFFRCPKKMEPQPFPLIIRAFDKKFEEKGILQAENWFFTMGDYDVI